MEPRETGQKPQRLRVARALTCSRGGLPSLLIAELLLLIAVPVRCQESSADAKGLPTLSEVDSAVELATRYLEHANAADGKFAYRVDISSGREGASYDILRHAGAVYALAMANRAKPNAKAAEAMVRAARFLRQNYMGPSVRRGELVVWSKPLGEDRHPVAELGGAGLGLVALAEVRKVNPETVPLKDLQALGRFVLFLQREDGSFVDKYREDEGPVAYWESLYYPGEAALGLIELYEADHSKAWLEAAAKGLDYLAQKRAGRSTVPADHWALIATARLFPYLDRVAGASRERLTQHAVQVCNSILRDQFRGGARAGLDGAFDPDGRIAPTATRLEGLISAAEFLPEGPLRERIAEAAGRGIAFLLREQIKEGPATGGLPGAVVKSAADASKVRVDYVQHSLCAWLRYRQLYLSRGK
jgi:hypothetical protein